MRISTTFMALAIASMTTISAYAVTPGQPSMEMTFEIRGDEGLALGTATAPRIDNKWGALPADTKMDLRIVRSCMALEEEEIPVVSFSDMAPGETREFTDDATPAWQYGYQYTYYIYASIGNEVSIAGYGSLYPGIQFSFPYGGVSATPKEDADGNFSVEISAYIPDHTNYPIEPIPVDMTALEIYRVTNTSTNEMELIHSIPNPVKGDRYEWTDTNPAPNAMNTYLVKCMSKFGFTQLQVEAYVGLDVPDAPYPVKGEWLPDGGYRLWWPAPTTGVHYGEIDPELTFYNIYRCWGREENERELIASELKETEYVDYGKDMDKPRAVMYMVEAANKFGVGGFSTSSYTYDVLIGPAIKAPFIESFDGGTDQIWAFTNSSYYATLTPATSAEFGSPEVKVDPVKGTGLIYVDFTPTWVPAGSNVTMTSYYIDMTQTKHPYLSFYAYMIPGCGVDIKAAICEKDGEFEVVCPVSVNETSEAEWRNFLVDVSRYAGKEDVRLRFTIDLTDTNRGAGIIDQIMLLDYPAVGELFVEYAPEECSATISWEDPSTDYAVVSSYEGFVDGKSVGTVESPWIYVAPEYRKEYKLAVVAHYGEAESPRSEELAIYVPRPAITEFTVSEHTFTIVPDLPIDTHQLIIKKYLGEAALYKVPELVTYDDVTYTVIGISSEAYAGNTALASVDMHDDLRFVGESAFRGCKGILSVSFGKGLESIESKAFADCTSLERVTFTSTTLPFVADDAFSGIAEGCKGYCPADMATEYSGLAGLAPLDFGVSGILLTPEELAAMRCFDLQGRPLKTPVYGHPCIVNGRRIIPLRR